MRILFVLEHFHPYIGGAEHLFWELSRALTDRGHDVRVVTTRFRADLPAQECIDRVTIRRVNCVNRYLFSFVSIPEVIAEARSADLIHTTSYNAALPAFISAKWRKKPVVVTFHEVWASLWWSLPLTPFWLKTAYWTWEQILLKLPFDRFVGVSQATANALVTAGVNPSRVKMIYNGLDYSRFSTFSNHPPSAFTFTYFGRLGTSKGLDFLLPAASRFLKKHPEAIFKLIIPKIPDGIYNWVMQELKDVPNRSQIRIFHDLDQHSLFTEVSSSSCVTIPSRSEGFCFVAAEAVAMGLPVLSSERTALAEVVGGPFIHIDPLSEEGVFQALEQARQGDWKYKEILHFPLDRSVDHYLKLFEEMIQTQ